MSQRRTAVIIGVVAVVVAAGKPGTYRYLCPVPGQARDGMAGTFAVAS